jgi:hypothetical protein
MKGSIVSTLVQIAFIFAILFLMIRVLAQVVAGLGSSRTRAYRQLAKRFGGRYESRGLVDPPTVSFRHGHSLVRVGLAPVVAGQPALPRTRVVARFSQGLPFRLELTPTGRKTPPQPPKGTRPVPTGLPEFDQLYLIQANDPDITREFIQPMAVRQALDALRRLAPPAGMLLSINPERLLVQVDRNLGLSSALLDLAVRAALLLHDALLTSVSTRLTEGIAITEIAAVPPSSSLPECKVCGSPIEGPHVRCRACHSPFHRDCWNYIGACSTFGCTCRENQPAG